MRWPLLATVAVLVLAACDSWNWRRTGHDFLQNACRAADNCTLDCAGPAAPRSAGGRCPADP